MRFVADPAKAAANRRNHGITFAEGATVFGDPLAYENPDEAHAGRFTLVGLSDRGHLLFVVYEPVAADLTRIISARRVTPHERKDYEEQS